MLVTLVISLELKHANPNKVSLIKSMFFNNLTFVSIGYCFELVDIVWISSYSKDWLNICKDWLIT